MTSLEIVVPVLTFLLGSVLASISKGVIREFISFLKNRFYTRDQWIRGPRDDIKVVEWEELGGAWTFRGKPATGWKLLVENKGKHHIIIRRCRFTGAIYIKRTLTLQAKRVYRIARQIRHAGYLLYKLRFRFSGLRAKRPNRDYSGLLSSYRSSSGRSLPRISTSTIKNIYIPPGSSITWICASGRILPTTLPQGISRGQQDSLCP